MSGRLQFILIMIFVAMAFFAGYGFGRQDGTKESNNGSSVAQEESGHGHGGSNADAEEADGMKTSAEWTTTSANAGEETEIRIAVKDESGNPVDGFDIEHEKLLHLIVVSKDLSYFNHIHPAYEGEGEFVVTNRFPAGGEFKLIADYVPTGGSKTTSTEWVTIAGAAEETVPLTPDRTHTKSVDGIEVTLGNDHPIAGEDVELAFRIADAATQEPITDLEPYLGAVGHVVVISADTEQYLHVHPLDEDARGPDAKFATSFPKPGIYKVWAQFQRDGRVITVPFVIEVK